MSPTNPLEYATLVVLLLILALLARIVWEYRRRSAPRVILPMTSGVNIKPDKSTRITGRPVSHAFRPERIIISDAAHWIVNDILVRGVSQFVQSGDVPGEMFDAHAIDAFVRLDIADLGTDVEFVVTYVGPLNEGAPFVCGIVGTATRSSRPARSRPPERRSAYATA